MLSWGDTPSSAVTETPVAGPMVNVADACPPTQIVCETNGGEPGTWTVNVTPFAPDEQVELTTNGLDTVAPV